MNTTWFEKHYFAHDAVEFFAGQKNLEDAWLHMRADVAMDLVAALPTLAARCRWVSSELARQFTLFACAVENCTGQEVDGLKACAPVVDAATASSVATDARRACSVQALAVPYCARATAESCEGAIHFAPNEFNAVSLMSAPSAACAARYNSMTGHKSDPRLADMVRANILWQWVYEAAKADAPELLEDARA